MEGQLKSRISRTPSQYVRSAIDVSIKTQVAGEPSLERPQFLILLLLGVCVFPPQTREEEKNTKSKFMSRRNRSATLVCCISCTSPHLPAWRCAARLATSNETTVTIKIDR
ncbi:uncharacterized protein [Solanum tuberosum]|uniref:uncharacterized protein isoform X2 n=1 Tax=Solanum tuberosum TaxID=4113 RepID=UPI00073A05D6|nr:PREDICTED: uncharacterized protein LOC102585924 isoform X2 [Solanum tuberosum]